MSFAVVADSGAGWKIELAQRAGIGLDTLRFCQREGLVPPGERRGQSN